MKMTKEIKISLGLMIGGMILQLLLWSQQDIGSLSFPYFCFGGIILTVIYVLILQTKEDPRK